MSTNQSGNGDKTRQFGLRAAIVVVAVLVLMFGVALFQGILTVPAEVQAQVWTIIVGLLAAGSYAVNTYMTARSAARLREGAAQEAALTRQRSDANAKETREKVQEGIEVMHNGLAKKTADIVKENAEKTASDLRSSLMADTTRAEVAALTAKLDALLAAAVARPVPAVADPTAQLIEQHTRETAANTARDEPDGSAV